MNLVGARLDREGVEFGGIRIPLAPDRRPDRSGDVVLGIRPESFQDAAFADPALPRLDVSVSVVEDLGSDTHVIFPLDAPRVDTEDVRRAVDDETTLTDTAVFNARVDARTAARPGASLRLAVDPAGFHWFDSATGASLKRRATSAATELAALR
jgi:multiple sugar transport system ATP-binding protein